MLRGYQGEDIEIQLPGDLTVHDIDWLAIWCITFRENFGHVLIPKDLDVPPALGQNQLTVIQLFLIEIKFSYSLHWRWHVLTPFLLLSPHTLLFHYLCGCFFCTHPARLVVSTG